MSDPRLSLRWGVTGQFGHPLFTACSEEYTAKQQAAALSGTMGCKVVDFGESVPFSGDVMLQIAAERHEAALALKGARAAHESAQKEADGLRISLVGSENRLAEVETSVNRAKKERDNAIEALRKQATQPWVATSDRYEQAWKEAAAAANEACPPKGGEPMPSVADQIRTLRAERDYAHREVTAARAERDALCPPYNDALSRVCAERDAACKSLRDMVERNGLIREADFKDARAAAEKWAAFRVRVSAEAQKIVDIAAALRIQG